MAAYLMTLGTRLFFLRLFAPLLLGAMMLSAAGCSQSSDDLIQVETEKEANQILSILYQPRESDDGRSRPIVGRKVAVEKQRKTVWQISVPTSDLPAARQLLIDLDLPGDKRSGLEAMTQSAGLIPSRTDERARLMHAVASELETTMLGLPGVVSARVHVVLPETNPLERQPRSERQPTKPEGEAVASPAVKPGSVGASFAEIEAGTPRSSVLLRTIAGSDAKPSAKAELETSARSLVLGAIDGVSPEHIAVVVVQAKPSVLPPAAPVTLAELARQAVPLLMQRNTFIVLVGTALAVMVLFLAVIRLRRGTSDVAGATE